jgi:hypothetical protein
MFNKDNKISIDKKEAYSTESFTAYIRTRNGNFSTSASSDSPQKDKNTTYQVLNKVTERKVYATRRK